METVCSAQHLCHWYEITYRCKLRVMTAVELHVNTKYYSQYPLLKSVYEKTQPVMSGELFSSYKTLFELAQGL